MLPGMRGLPLFGSAPTLITDVFAVNTWTGNGTSITVTTNINLSGNDGLVWFKDRTAAQNHFLYDTVRGTQNSLTSNNTNGQANQSPNGLSAFSATGFTVGSNQQSGDSYVSWTFRKAAGFFDVVTYTGTGVARTISHSLGSAPGLMLVKCVTTGYEWAVYHRNLANTQTLVLNSTAAASTYNYWNNTTPTASVFSVGTSENNLAGDSYVAYLFGHDTSASSLIYCGSFTTDGTGNATVTGLPFQPQWVMNKSTGVSSWQILDVTRGWTTGNFSTLFANVSDAEVSANRTGGPSTNGFTVAGLTASTTYIYMAIKG